MALNKAYRRARNGAYGSLKFHYIAAVEGPGLLVYDAASLGDWFPTFRGNVMSKTNRSPWNAYL